MKNDLPPEAFAAIERCVRDVVAAQRATPDAALYVWTKDYGPLGDVDLAVPPGESVEWTHDAVEVRTSAQPTYRVVVQCGQSRRAARTSAWR